MVIERVIWHIFQLISLQQENVAAYIAGSKKLGVPDQYNFMTVDLFEKKNLAQVMTLYKWVVLNYYKGGAKSCCSEENKGLWIRKSSTSSSLCLCYLFKVHIS